MQFSSHTEDYLPIITIPIDIFLFRTKNCPYTSTAAQGGGGSFKNRKPIGEVGCCESRIAERIH